MEQGPMMTNKRSSLPWIRLRIFSRVRPINFSVAHVHPQLVADLRLVPPRLRGVRRRVLARLRPLPALGGAPPRMELGLFRALHVEEVPRGRALRRAPPAFRRGLVLQSPPRRRPGAPSLGRRGGSLVSSGEFWPTS